MTREQARAKSERITQQVVDAARELSRLRAEVDAALREATAYGMDPAAYAVARSQLTTAERRLAAKQAEVRALGDELERLATIINGRPATESRSTKERIYS